MKTSSEQDWACNFPQVSLKTLSLVIALLCCALAWSFDRLPNLDSGTWVHRTQGYYSTLEIRSDRTFTKIQQRTFKLTFSGKIKRTSDGYEFSVTKAFTDNQSMEKYCKASLDESYRLRMGTDRSEHLLVSEQEDYAVLHRISVKDTGIDEPWLGLVWERNWEKQGTE